MNGGRSVWFFVVLAAWLAGCDVDSGVNGAPDAGPDAATVMLVNAGNNPFPCLHPVPAPTLGDGIFQCANGMQIQPEVPVCPASDVPASDACRTDSDCGATLACACRSSCCDPVTASCPIRAQ